MQQSFQTKKITKNTLFLYLRQILVLGITLYISRVILLTLGVEDFGIYNVLASCVTMFSFIVTTLGSASQRFLSVKIVQNDSKELNKTFSLITISYLLLIVILFLLSETVGLWFVNTSLNIPIERVNAANWAYQFTIFTLIINLMNAPFMSLLLAYEKIGVYAYISIGDVLIKLLVVIVLGYLDIDKLVLYSVLLFCNSLVITFIYYFICVKILKYIKIIWYFKKKDFWEILNFTCWNLIGSFANVLRSQGINILLNIFFNPSINAARGIAHQVNSAITNFSSNFYLAVKPQIIKNYALGDVERMHSLILMSSRLSFFLLFILVLPTYFFVDTILVIWLKQPPEYTNLFTRLILINLLLESFSQPLVVGLQAANKIKIFQLTVSVFYLLNLPISYIILLQGGGPLSPMYVNIFLVLLVFIPRLLINRHYINLSIKKYLKDVILKILLVVAIVLPLSVWLLQITKEYNCFLMILLKIIVLEIFTVLTIYLCGLETNEQKSINKKLCLLRKKVGI